MKKLFLLLPFVTALTASAQTASPKYPFQDPSLPRQERVENLLSLLTPEEKVGLMMNKSISVDRLGIPSYNWWSEACHGVRQGGYTVFPQPIGMAAAFSEQLVYDVFTAVSDEARANWNRTDHSDPKLFNVPMGVTYYPGNPELTFWCPNVNIFRDPRWGRGQETCGEDPYMNAVLGVQTVLGMQGNDPNYLKTHACAKHYAVHSGPACSSTSCATSGATTASSSPTAMPSTTSSTVDSTRPTRTRSAPPSMPCSTAPTWSAAR